MKSAGSLPCSQEPANSEALCNISQQAVSFYGEELLAPRPTPKLEDHPLSAIHDTVTATLHPQPEDAPCRGDRDPLLACNDVTQQSFCGAARQNVVSKMTVSSLKKVSCTQERADGVQSS
jgi:hypothetical protein